jgi:hypothetical protein
MCKYFCQGNSNVVCFSVAVVLKTCIWFYNWYRCLAGETSWFLFLDIA